MGKRSFLLKYILLSFLALAALFIVLLSKPGIARAAENVATPSNAEYEPNTDTTETSRGIITAITGSDGQPLESSYAVTVPAGDSGPLDGLLWKVLRVQATVEGGTEAVTLDVDWDYSSLTSNLDTPGEYTHTASILADGYTFADEVMQSLTIVVTVTEAVEKEPDVIQSFDSLSNRYAYAVAVSSDWQEFWNSQFADYRWEQTWPCHTAEGETLYANITWENPEPDMSQTGIVTVRGTAVLPENSVLADGLTLPTVEAPVSIQSEPTLECWCADADVVYIPWVMGDLEDDGLRFLASVNGGEWEDAGEWMDTNGESVCVWIDYLEEGSTYQVKVAWDGGETNAFEFTWDGAVTDAGPVVGDRDMIGRDGDDTGDLEQPAPSSPELIEPLYPADEPEPDEPAAPAESTDPGSPEPIEPLYPADEPEPDEPAAPEESTDPGFSGPVEPDGPAAGPEPNEPDTPVRSADGEADKASSARPSALEETPYPVPDGLEGQEEPADTPDEQPQVEAEPPMERVTDTQTTIGGERLRQLIEVNPESILFEKQGIAVSIPTGFLRELELAAYELLTVSIEPCPSGFIFTIFRDGQELSDLPETFVRFPAASLSAGEEYLLQRAGDAAQIPVELDGAAGLLCAYITKTGQYTFVKTSPAYPQGEALSVEVLSFTPDAPEPAFSAPALALGVGALCVVSALGLWIWRGRRGR